MNAAEQRGKAYWLKLIKDNGEEGGGMKILARVAILDYNDVKPVIDQLVLQRYVETEFKTGSDPRSYYRLTTLGHRYLNEHQDELSASDQLAAAIDAQETAVKPHYSVPEDPLQQPHPWHAKTLKFKAKPCVDCGRMFQPSGTRSTRCDDCLTKAADPEPTDVAQTLPQGLFEEMRVAPDPVAPVEQRAQSPTPPPDLDEEIGGMQAIYRLLARHSPDSQTRMMVYISNRLKSDDEKL